MSKAQREPVPMSLEEYFAFERRAESRHEFVEGFVYAMSGATKRHNRIVGNTFHRFRGAERGTGCRAYVEAVMLHLGDRVYYPDVMVSCGPPSDDPYVEEAPTVLVEVLSESTWHIDRREKRSAYRAIPRLAAYLIVAQDERYVHRHWRDGEGEWRYEVLEGSGEIPLPGLGITLTLDDIYEGVDFPPPEQRLRIREEAAAYG